MKAAALSLALFLALAAPAAAGPCEEGLGKIDSALQDPALAPDLKAQAQDMRNQAAQLCSAGNEEEGVDVLAEAGALLGVE